MESIVSTTKAAVERAMKFQEAILQVLTKRIPNTVPILEVNTTKKTATELKDYLPGYANPKFSHDGKMVYAMEGNSVLINTFNPATGELGDHDSLSIPAGASITAW